MVRHRTDGTERRGCRLAPSEPGGGTSNTRSRRNGAGRKRLAFVRGGRRHSISRESQVLVRRRVGRSALCSGSSFGACIKLRLSARRDWSSSRCGLPAGMRTRAWVLGVLGSFIFSSQIRRRLCSSFAGFVPSRSIHYPMLPILPVMDY